MQPPDAATVEDPRPARASTTPGERTPAAPRLAGIDVARALAILGMVTVHFGPIPVRETGVVPWLYGSFYGKASVLFVVVAGVGVALMGGRRTDRLLRARLLYRTVWLLPVGLALQALDHWVAVILQYYAVYFLLLVPFVARRDRTLLAWAAALLPLGSAAVLTVEVLRPGWVLPLGGDSPLGVPGDVLLFGYYPAVTWLPPMLVGLWLGRRDLGRRAVRWALLLGGAATLTVTSLLGHGLQRLLGVAPTERSWWWVLSVEGHSEMPLAVVGATGFAAAVIGASLLAADRWPRLLHPLAALGRLALSVYVGHILVLVVVPDLLRVDDVAEGVRTVAAFTVVTAALSAVWLRFARRGPLEALVRWPWQRIAPRLPTRPRTSGGP